MNSQPNPVRIVTTIVGVVATAVLLFIGGSLFETLDSSEVMVIQYPTGHMRCETLPGIYGQYLGKVTKYKKQSTYGFSAADDQEGKAIAVQFADGAHGTINGTLAWQMPLTCEQILKLHAVTGTQEAIEQRFIRPVTEKAVYFAGPLMTSKESYSERKGELLSDIEDQITNGVYRTQIVTKKEADAITGIEKTVSQVLRVQNAAGLYARQDASPLSEFGLRTYNLEIKVAYDKNVEEQIQEQQKLAMAVQTAVATAKQAEQRAITVAKEGEANAAKARWDVEVTKAQMVTKAEAELAVAQKNNEIAEQYRQATLKKADADATYRERMMKADGALEKRLNAQIEIAKYNADAIKNIKVPIVPTTVFGSSQSGGAATLLDLMTIQAAKAVGVNKD